MSGPIVEDFAAIAGRPKQIKAGIEPTLRKPDCATCDDLGWLRVQTEPPRWDCCFSCGNAKGRASP